MPNLFQRPVIIFGGFWSGFLGQSEHNLRNIQKSQNVKLI